MHENANGTRLQTGDKVVIPCEVLGVSCGEEYCNVAVVTTLGRRPDGRKKNLLRHQHGAPREAQRRRRDAEPVGRSSRHFFVKP